MTDGDWSLFVAGLSVVVALVALGVAWAQVTLMNRHEDLMRTQLRITEKQDELMTQQLARRAVLVMKIVFAALPAPHLKLSVKNDGTRAAGNFYWHVAIPAKLLTAQPPLLMPPSGGGIPSSLEQGYNLAGQSVVYYNGLNEHPVYPSREATVGHVALSQPVPTGDAGLFAWQLVAEDGVYPDKDRFQTVDARFPVEPAPSPTADWTFEDGAIATVVVSTAASPPRG